jgi:hypothetical protein
MIGRPVWWADTHRWDTAIAVVFVVGVFSLITFLCVWSFFRGPLIPEFSVIGSLLLGGSALADRNASPGGAVVTAVLAFSALLFAFAGLSGRAGTSQDENFADSSSSTDN